MKNQRMSKSLKILFAVFGLLSLFACGVGIRMAVLHAQKSFYDRPLPFTLESALQYRLVETIYHEGRLPVRDEAVQFPEGIVIRETYTIGAEYVYAWLVKLMPDSIPLDYRVRLVSIGWFSLGIPLLCLWLFWWLRSWWPALLGGAYYAVSLASVMRSTGQELSHENFAFPLLIGHLAMSALADSRAHGRIFWMVVFVSAVLMGCAVATWDMVQFYVLLWVLIGFARFVRGGYFDDVRRRLSWWIHVAVLIIAGVSNPYLRTHAFLFSYAMLIGYGTALGLLIEQVMKSRLANKPLLRRRTLKIAVALVPILIGFFVFRGYDETYGHFMELLWAKLRFLNQKPNDPALLTFAQRILWTPALHSVGLKQAFTMFPVILPLLLISVPAILFDATWRSDAGFVQTLFFTAASLAAFILFMRFHVFLVVFGVALLGWTVCRLVKLRDVSRPPGPAGFLRRAGWMVIIIMFFCGVAAEAAHTLTRPVRWGRRLTYIAQQEELIDWLRDNAEGSPVLANFGLSAFLLAHAGSPIVLHPKFESADIRDRVKAYGEALFLSDESAFRAWANQYGAELFVFSLGEFAPVHQELQMRYFVNALSPPPEAAALLFENEPEKLGILFIYGATRNTGCSGSSAARTNMMLSIMRRSLLKLL